MPKLTALLPEIRKLISEIDAFKLKKKIDTREDDSTILSNIIKELKELALECDKEDIKLDLSKVVQLIRPDLDQSDEEFLKDHTGYKEEIARAILAENPETLLTSASEINKFVSETISLVVQNKNNPNYCDPLADTCDRRKISQSCESRLPVDDQGDCGSSWAFASSHMLSLTQCIATNKLVAYSEQEILDCSQYSCEGGHTLGLLKWLGYTKHLSAEKSYPYYTSQKKVCRAKGAKNHWNGKVDIEKQSIFTLAKRNIRHADWVSNVKKLVAVQGGVIVTLNVKSFRYKGKRPTEHCELDGSANHVAVLTGWDKDTDGRQYWIFRNSWGVWWGDDGYGKIYIDTDCPPSKHPFNSIEVLTVLDFNNNVKEDSKEPESSYITAIGRVTQKLNCTKYANQKINIQSAYYDNSAKHVEKCKHDATSVIKHECLGKTECLISFDNLKKETNVPDCANQVNVLWDCGELTFATETPTTKPATLEPALKFNCNLAKSIEAGNDEFCIDICGRAAIDCANHISMKCIKDTMFQYYKQDYCDVSEAVNNKQTKAIQSHIIDCTGAVGINSVTNEYCISKCIDIKARYWCSNHDYICLTDAQKYEGTRGDCDMRGTFVKTNSETTVVHTAKKVNSNGNKAKNARRANSKKPKRNAEIAVNCNNVYHISPYAVGGFCVVTCFVGLQHCKNNDMPMSCIKNLLTAYECDPSDLENKTTIIAKKIDCQKLEGYTQVYDLRCNAICNEALAKGCVSNDLVCLLNHIKSFHPDYFSACNFYKVFVNDENSSKSKQMNSHKLL